ncbi:hypothetical protein [Micromonospora arborensis]|uniref:hypothetical protein n=1 Tax=Micromonospora arborensis TaxID=2116518 RepID=UPI0037177F51
MTTRHASPPIATAVTGAVAVKTGSLAMFVTDLAARVGVTAPLVAEQMELLAPATDLITRQARLLGLLESAIMTAAREHGMCRPGGCRTCQPVRRGMAALVADAAATQARIDRAGVVA